MIITQFIIAAAARHGLNFAQPERLRFLWIVPLVWLLSAGVRRRGGAASLAAALVLRTLALVLAVFAFSGLGVKREEKRAPTVIAAVDVSDSMGKEGRAWARERARAILDSAGPETLKGVISFADGSEMKASPGRSVRDGMFAYEIPTGETDIAEAIGTALLAFPPEGPKRLLLFSDGNETEGDAASMAELAARDGVRIDCFAPPEREVTEAVMKKLDLPEEVNVSEKFTIRVLGENRGKREMRAALTLRDGDDLIKRWTVTLHPGTNAFEVPYGIETEGVHEISAVLGPERAVPGAEEGSGVSAPLLVVGRPKVLCLSGTPDGKSFLAEALEARDIETRVGGAELLPGDLDGLLEYDCVVVSNVPRAELGEKRMVLLEEYVRDHGGGLVMLGNSASFGPGGYRGTPVERVLPVSAEKEVPFTKEKMVRLCIILVVDKSGSMDTPRRKIVAARRAAEELVKQLKPNDMVGIIPFDTRAKNLVPLEPVDGRKSFIIDRIRLIQPGGGTLIAPALEIALKEMRRNTGRVKHVILLSDGESDDVKYYNYAMLIREFRRSGVSLSTVGIGRGADEEFLMGLAVGTGGKYYYVQDPTTLPIIVIEDTRKVLEKSGFLEEAFTPKFGRESRMLRGISPAQVPKLLGHAITKAKPRAEVALYTDIRRVRDPVLAGWRYGLGKAVAFTSDAEARWSKEMVGWGMFRKFWVQVLRWAMRERSQSYYLASVKEERGKRYIELTDYSPAREGAEFRIVLPGEGGEKGEAIALHQTAPHTYRGEAGAVSPFTPLVTVERMVDGKETDSKEVPLVRRAPAAAATAETAAVGVNDELLGAVAAAAGGLYSPRRDELRFEPEVVPVSRGLTTWLMPFIFVLLLADIALRKWG